MSHTKKKRTMASQKLELSVPSMSCEKCVNKINAALSTLDGVADVKSDLAKKRVAIRFDAAKLTERQLENALGKVGFASARA